MHLLFCIFMLQFSTAHLSNFINFSKKYSIQIQKSHSFLGWLIFLFYFWYFSFLSITPFSSYLFLCSFPYSAFLTYFLFIFFLSYSLSAQSTELKTCCLYPLKRSKTSLKKGCPGYDTKLHLMVRLQFWRSKECGVFCHCHYFTVHSDTGG